jgi:hypothetical protein
VDELRQDLLSILGARRGRASFVQEIRAALGRPLTNDADFERALQELETSGSIIVRQHFCGDPHLDGADLRVAALLERDSPEDTQASAIAAIETAWQRWIGDYLASHRCT